MLIRADISSNKTDFLVKKYIEILSLGAQPYEILFLVQNSYKKKVVTDYLKSVKFDFSPVNTFGGLIYNTVKDNWNEISPKIKIGETKEKPNLCSMELSQYIMKRCITEVGFKDYFSKVNLLHQLFRRYYLIQQNELNDKEIKKRSKMLGETWGEEAQKVLKKFEEKTLEHKCFDYLRQMPIFKYIYKNTNYFQKIKYLILDDGDEITQFELNFIKYLAPQLKDYYICYDPKGASRSGYLSAKKNIEKDFVEIFNNTPTEYNYTDTNAEKYYQNLTREKTKIKNFNTKNFLTRLQMVNDFCEEINSLLKSGLKNSEIAIIAPEVDFTLESFLKKYIGGKKFLSGNKKLVQDVEVRNFITIIKLANPSWNIKIEPFEINSLLNNFLNIPLKYCQKIFTEFKKSNKLVFFEFKNKKYEINYRKLLIIIENISKLTLSDSIIEIQKIKGSSEKINFLLKQIKEFETLFEKNKYNKKLQKNIILQFENSMIAENSADKEIDTSKIIVSTPQKFIDISKKVKYQFWIDLSSSKWLVEDVGNIYNAWGFQTDIEEMPLNYDDLLNLTKDKTGRMLRKLALLTDKVLGFSSCYDSSGYENQNGILEFLICDNNNDDKINIKKQIEPRDDQKPVLNYDSGKMGIAAVPGAGKTTVLLLLIIKLLTQNKINPENIFVLTYMDSAAKHFKEKLIEFLPDLKTLPNISTIHGLCLRILKDNSNYVRVNLDPDFQVCDELNRKAFIYGALIKSNLKEDDFPLYEKALSMAKLNPDIDLNTNDKSLYKFKKIFDNYNKILYENSMIDYDDMIFYAVKLLEENLDILSEYQNTCKYIIEDEAQDSSLIQNKLLNLLSGKHKNLIRCGDPNQAITTTFTNADTKGFRKFIDTNKNVKMSSSQRCSKPIYTFANKLMENYPEAFYKNIINGTNFNPQNTENVSFKEFENDSEEKIFILNEIKKFFVNNKNASVAILLRNNYQVENYIEFLKTNEINAVEKTDSLKNNRVYNVISAIFEMLEFPYNNKILSEGLKKLCKEKIYDCKEEDLEKLKNLQEPFLTSNPDDFNSFELGRFWWDFDYIFSNSNNGFDYLITVIADYYFEEQTTLENAYMLAQVARKFMENTKTEQTFYEKFKALKNLSNIGLVKLLKEDKNLSIQNLVEVMTIHKAKGDEFDYVFLPEMSDKLFSLSNDVLKISSESHFCECLKPKEKRRTVEEMKKEYLDETLHLIYVAVTRAKKRLYISYSKNIKKGSKKLSPCEIFNLISKT